MGFESRTRTYVSVCFLFWNYYLCAWMMGTQCCYSKFKFLVPSGLMGMYHTSSRRGVNVCCGTSRVFIVWYTGVQDLESRVSRGGKRQPFVTTYCVAFMRGMLPIIHYLRPVFRSKSLGQTSVALEEIGIAGLVCKRNCPDIRVWWSG